MSDTVSPPETPQPMSVREASPLRMSMGQTRKILPWAALFGLTAIGGTFFLSHGSPSSTVTSKTGKHPALDSPAGGNNRTTPLEKLTTEEESLSAEKAQKNGDSFTAQIRGRDLPKAHAPLEIGDTPGTPARTASVDPAPKITLKTAAPTTDHAASPKEPKPAAIKATASQRVTMAPSRPQRRLSNDVKSELLAAWSGRGADLSMLLPEKSGTSDHSSRQESRQTDRQSADSSTVRPSATAKKVSSPTKGTLLLAAGRGVYAHSLLTSNSDLGTQVLAEIDSGPLLGDRVSGTLQMKNDRLLIKFTKLMRGDDAPISISGYAVSPDTAETGVASEVKQHLALRVLLPAAAGFVQGLGNAAQNSNTTSVTSGLGVSSFTHLTLPEQLAVGAGQGAQAFAQALTKMTPKQDTVLLDKDDPIGVIFDEPVYASPVP